MRKLPHLARPEEQFNAGSGSPTVVVQGVSSFTQIPPAYIHPNMVRVLMGCSILGMLFNLDLLLLESVTAFQIRQGGRQGTCAGQGLWAGLAVHPDRAFAPTSVEGQDKRGKLVEWVEKASFDRLNRLFEIAAAERSCETLLSA
ncbi:hypothetical protein CK203_113611 [Vitis vinifera]|uniref:Uncharacterized protein n=1 Tax=Vitis vinifera TaxID=29760 RepID=A0A438FEH1_VITVI|nr:hypothetical protein CK203_113611 [Vitis vinifera]